MRNAITPKSRIGIILIIVCVAIVITGCVSTGSSSQKNYRTGTTGLVLEFSKSNPAEVYEGEEFGTSLFIRNIGSTTVTASNPASLSVIYDSYSLSIKDNAASAITGIYLDGKSQYYPKGGEAPVEFYFKANKLTNLREGVTTEITYNLCYPYATEFTTSTCIDTKTANRADDAAACVAENYNGASGQGGPIVVTKIEPEIMLQQDYIKPQYKIYLENQGNGYVTNRPTCDLANVKELFGTGYNDYSGKVTVYAELSGQRLECGQNKDGIIRLSEDESVITCSLPRDSNTYSRTKKNYLTMLSIKIVYTYVLLEKQELQIKRNDLIEPEITQGFCNSYQVEENHKCIDKCVFCSERPNDDRCQEGTSATALFKTGFSCSCSQAQCNEKESSGNCIKGNYCAKGVYCCNTLKCNATQISYNGECYNKCNYCALYGQNDPNCKYSGTAQVNSIPSTFSCRCTQANIEDPNGLTIIRDQSFCDVNSGLYCCG